MIPNETLLYMEPSGQETEVPLYWEIQLKPTQRCYCQNMNRLIEWTHIHHALLTSDASSSITLHVPRFEDSRRT
jgi:hypothetical protein